jgi:hypothetical protein
MWTLWLRRKRANELRDDELLTLATALRRAVVTQDIRFRVMVEDWQRTGRHFAGLIIAQQRRVSYGEMIFDLELIAKATEAEFWSGRIEQLPL